MRHSRFIRPSRRLRHLAGCVFGVVLVTMLTGCGWSNVQRVSETRTTTAQHMVGAPLVIEARNGSVEVVTDDAVSEVEITAVVTCGGTTKAIAEQRLADTHLLVQRDTARQLVIRPVFSGGRAQNGDGVKIAIRMPDATNVQLTTSNGSVKAIGLGGPLEINTSNGSVVVEDVDGEADIRTSNGSVVARHISGQVTVVTSNGSVKVNDIDGKVAVDTSNASIQVVLNADQAGPVELDTSNGSIRLDVGPAFNSNLAMDTSNARIVINDPDGLITASSLSKSEGRITVGSGQTKSIADTSNARIEINIES